MQQQKHILSKIFSETLIKARGNRSQAEFARALGIKHQQTYQAYEAGRVPDGITLHQIATKLGVTIDQLFTAGKPEDAAIMQTRDGNIPIPWGFELEQSTQFLIALNTLSEHMSASQLAAAMQAILQNRELTDKSKLFWSHTLNAWLKSHLDTEEFKRLSPQEQVARRREINAEKTAKRQAMNPSPKVS